VVDVALILGPTTPAPLAVRVLTWQHDADLQNHLVAAAGALLQVGVTGMALVAWLAGERVAARLCARIGRSGARMREDRALRRTGLVLMVLSAAIVLSGIALLALWSVARVWRFPDLLPAGLTLATWMRLGGDLGLVLANTLALALVSSVAATALALGALESASRAGLAGAGRAFGALYVPLIAPQVAFLSGLQMLLSFGGLDGRFAAVALVHLVFVFPYVLLSLDEPWRAWDPRHGRMMRALGHGPNAVFWRARLPMLARPVLTGAALGFAVSVALYLPTLIIGGGRWPTVTTEAVALASGGDPRLIGATALLQATLPFLGFGLAALVPLLLFRNRRAMRAGT
jgi:putative thiamine transport system permease protein